MRTSRFAAVTTALLVASSLLASSASATPPPPTCETVPTCVNGLEYVDQNNGTARIVNFFPEDIGVTVIVPSVVDLGAGNLDVVSIDADVFDGAGLENLGFTPPSNVISIGDDAFADNDLGGLVLPDSLKFVGSSAFAGAGLTGPLIFGPNVEVIGSHAFENNLFNSPVEIPPLVTDIAESAFAFAGVTDIDFGDNSILESIGHSAFAENSITGLSVPDSVATIEGQAFNNNDIANIYFTNGSGLTTIGGSAFLSNELEQLTIPAAVTSIGARAFDGNDSLSDVEFRGQAPTIFGKEDSGVRSFDATLDPLLTYFRQYDATQRDGGFTRPWKGYLAATDKVKPEVMKVTRPGKKAEKKNFTVSVRLKDEGRLIQGGVVRVFFKGRPNPQFIEVVDGVAVATFKAPPVSKTKRFDIIVTYRPGLTPYKKRTVKTSIRILNK